jgi:hypothetical protein
MDPVILASNDPAARRREQAEVIKRELDARLSAIIDLALQGQVTKVAAKQQIDTACDEYLRQIKALFGEKDEPPS